MSDGDWISIYEMAISTNVSKEGKVKSCVIQDRLFLNVVGDPVGNLDLKGRTHYAVT